LEKFFTDKLHSSYVSKIDRKELEDRYMCLVVDNSHLKRECNKREEKIKRYKEITHESYYLDYLLSIYAANMSI
jgi:hypothetical protein